MDIAAGDPLVPQSRKKKKPHKKLQDERIQFLVKNSHVWNATSNASCHAQSVGCASYVCGAILRL